MHTPVIITLGRLRKEGQKFMVLQGCCRLYLETNRKKTKMGKRRAYVRAGH